MELARRMAEELERLQASNPKSSRQNQKQAQQQAGYFERYAARVKDNLRVAISNIHIRLEDQREKVIEEYEYEVGIDAQQDASRRSNLPGKKTVCDKMCIGIMLQELTLKTVEYQKLADQAHSDAFDPKLEEFGAFTSSSDSEEAHDGEE